MIHYSLGEALCGEWDMEQETNELRRVGLKVTHPRMRILQIFDEEGARHLTDRKSTRLNSSH